MEKIAEILVQEGIRRDNEESFDLRSHGAIVFYSGFGGGGFDGSDRGFGGGFGSSSPSSRGSGGFGRRGGSSLGSGGGRYLDDSKPDYMGGLRSKEPDYMGVGSRPDPSGPLAKAIEIKPIEIDIAPVVAPATYLESLRESSSSLQQVLEKSSLISPPSSIGSAGRSRPNKLLEAVTAGHSNPPSGLGSAGRDAWKIEDFDYRGQGLGTGTELINVDREHKVTIKLYEDLENKETRLTFEPFGRHHRTKSTLLKMPWDKDE